MSLDELNACVTSAILHAEAEPVGSLEACRAFGLVCDLEVEIATQTKPDSLEGEIARLGAVEAALSSGDPLRALDLACRYKEEGPDAPILERLGSLAERAEREMDADDSRPVIAAPFVPIAA